MEPGQSTLKTLTISFISDTARINKELDTLILKLSRVMELSRGINVGMSGSSKASSGKVFNAMAPDPARFDAWNNLFGDSAEQVVSSSEKAGKALEDLAGPGKKKGSLGKFGDFLGKAFPPSIALAMVALESFMGMMGRLGRFIGKVIKYTVGQAFHYGNLVERGLTMMEVATGNVKKAHRTVQQSIDYSTKTPFREAEVLSGAALAQTYNIDPFEKGKYNLPKNRHAMDIIGGLASFPTATGEGNVGMARAVMAISRGDTRWLRPFGPKVLAAYERSLGAGIARSQPQIDKFIEELGKIPQVMEMAKKHSETVYGLWSTIVGLVDRVFIAISGANEERGVLTLWSQVRDILMDVRKWAIDITKMLHPFFVEIGSFLGSVFTYIYDIFTTIANLLAPVILPAFGVFLAIIRTIGALLTFGYQTIGKILKFVVEISKRVFGWTSHFSGFLETLNEFIAGLQATFQITGIFIDLVLEKVDKLLKKFPWIEKAFGGLALPGLNTGYEFSKKDLDKMGVFDIKPERDPGWLKKTKDFFRGEGASEKDYQESMKRYRERQKLKGEPQGMNTGPQINQTIHIGGLGMTDIERLNLSRIQYMPEIGNKQ